MVDFLGQGDLADRPASLDLHANGIGFYWAIDTLELYFWGGSPAAWIGPAPVTTTDEFIELTDVPSDYTGFGTYNVTVKAAEDGLEFTAAPAIPTTEQIQDIVGALIQATGTGITATYDDVANTLTIDCTITQYTDEMVRDIMGVALTAGAGITITPDDGANTITVACTITQYTDEMARDALGTALVAGAGITITPNDGADTITILSTITQYTDELAQDAVGAMLADTATIDATYTDGTPELKFDLKPRSINNQSASYTLVLADAYAYVRISNASANDLTVPLNATVAFPIGTVIPIASYGVGQTTVVATGGVTINTPETLKLRTRYSAASLTKIATDEWDLIGDLELL